MKKIILPIIAKCMLSSTILFIVFPLLAQTLVNFSGKWSYNQQKSKAPEGTSAPGSELTLQIIQDQNSIKITETNKTPDGTVLSESKDYTLDGKEKIIKEDSNGVSIVTKRTGKWSADKKQIILNEITSLGPNTFAHEDVFSSSDNGKTLVKQNSEVMNGRKESKTMVYDKK
jgi:hypothetical protein